MACSIPRVYFHHSCSPGDSVFSGVSKQRCQRKLPPAGGPKLRVRLGEKGSHQVSVTLRIQLRPGSVPSRCLPSAGIKRMCHHCPAGHTPCSPLHPHTLHIPHTNQPQPTQPCDKMLSLVYRKRRTHSNSRQPLHFLGKLAMEVPGGQSFLSLLCTQKLKAGLRTPALQQSCHH